MDYDKSEIAASYDRARGYSTEVMTLWLDTLAAAVPPGEAHHIVDLGCGTGRYSFALAQHFAARVTGIDPSQKMLGEARGKAVVGDVVFKTGHGEALPLADASADLIFCSMVYHHFEQPAVVASECWRVLRPGGRFALRNSTADQADSYAYSAFFPGVPALLTTQLPWLADIRATFEAAGFDTAQQRLVRHENAANWTIFTERLAAGADSILARLPEADFAAGLAALRAHAATAAGAAPVMQEIDFLVFRRPG